VQIGNFTQPQNESGFAALGSIFRSVGSLPFLFVCFSVKQTYFEWPEINKVD